MTPADKCSGRWNIDVCPRRLEEKERKKEKESNKILLSGLSRSVDTRHEEERENTSSVALFCAQKP